MPRRPSEVATPSSDWRAERLAELFALLQPTKIDPGSNGKPSESPVYLSDCSNYEDLVQAWEQALFWTDGLDRTLCVMLACSATVMLVGEQLWFRVIGPPSCGKTTLMEALATNKEHVLSKDTIRGFYSGDTRHMEGEDTSIAALSRGMTLGIKDADAILRAPNKDQILGEARGLYDRCGRVHYRNKVEIDYENHRMSQIWCGTTALHELDDSELGARFLDCVVMEGIENEFEDQVIARAVESEWRGMEAEADGEMKTQYSPELVRAMTLTGGYLRFLRYNVVTLTQQVTISPKNLQLCAYMGKFIAYMRARPSKKQDEHAEREFSARLSKQVVRLARALAIVLNKTSVDEEVMRRVRRVMLDTSTGLVLRIVEKLLEIGLQSQGLVNYLNEDAAKLSKLLRFLRKINVLRYSRNDSVWHVSKYIKTLYQRVVGDDR